jgi:hypothetical protein
LHLQFDPIDAEFMRQGLEAVLRIGGQMFADRLIQFGLGSLP